MDFYKLVKSLDALVFEILSWLYFYPRTLFRTFIQPYSLMADTEKQMDEDDEPAWGDRIGPPLFLALTLALIHLIELAIDPSGENVTYSNPRVAEFMADDKNLLGFRIIMFGCLPLIAAVRELSQRGIAVSKGSLQAPFYAQCYAAAGYAVLFNAGLFVAIGYFGPEHAIGAFEALVAGLLVALLWLGWVEARWFHRMLGISRRKALWHAFVVLAQWSLIALTLAVVVS